MSTLDQIDTDLRRVQAELEGARAAHHHSPNAETAARVQTLVALRDGILDCRLMRMVADAVVKA